MPTHSSHTHCQAPPANAQTKAWQRVCLPQRTTKPTDQQTDEREHRTHNITYTQTGVSCFVGKFSGKNPCLRIAEKRCATYDQK